MRLNKPANHMQNQTHEGAPAFSDLIPIQNLRRSVLACLLWENSFYEDGVENAKRIEQFAKLVPAEDLAALAIEARFDFNLRHVPLLLLDALTVTGAKRKDSLVRHTVARVTSGRADEMSECLAIYWRNGKRKLSAQLKKGLADAFRSFSAYELAKYDRDNAVKLRDVMFLVHPKPKDEAQAMLWKSLANKKLDSPDTWEVALSAGANKKETFERLLRDKKLGYLALLRNLRNMEQSGVDRDLVREALLARKGAHKVFPFRFIAAAKAVPAFESWIDEAMLAHFAQTRKIPGVSLVIIDVSRSMYGRPVSKDSDMDRALAACALGAIARELCEDPRVFATAGSDLLCKHATEEVPARRGMALVDAIYNQCDPLGGGGIFLHQVCNHLRKKVPHADRTIVITDEQDCDIHNKAIANPIGKGFLINVGSYKNGIGYGPWTNISGFSETVFRFILESETRYKNATLHRQ